MRIGKNQNFTAGEYKLMIVDDDAGLIDSITAFLKRNGYEICGFTDPLEGLEKLKSEKFDILILDYFMSPIKGDDFVSKLRVFDSELYVILLTGHQDLAPPFATIKAFDIQAYCEKSHRLDQLLLLIESGIKSIGQRRRITNFRDGLNNILSVLPEMYQFKPLEEIIENVLIHIEDLTGSTDILALIDMFGDEERILCKGTGRYKNLSEVITESFEPDFIDAINQVKTTSTALWTNDGVIFPIFNVDDFYEGVIYIEGELEDEYKNILEIFIVHVNALIHNAYLHEKLAHAYSSLKSSFVETIEALRLAVDAKDVYTRGHSERVSQYSVLIGKKIGLYKDALENLRIGGLFHDIGKIGIGDDILLKNTKLTKEEYAEIKEHPGKGALILSAVSAFENIKHIVESHHESIDGKGYPNGLKGEEIPLEARIICVADAYDAMTFDRQYRRRFTQSAAIDQLIEGSGTQFDKDIVDCFISLIDENSTDINAIFKFE